VTLAVPPHAPLGKAANPKVVTQLQRSRQAQQIFAQARMGLVFAASHSHTCAIVRFVHTQSSGVLHSVLLTACTS